MIHDADVLVIGGGVTGCGILRDLALRGIRGILIDKGDLASGASGGNHGLLHSGGRYAASDTETAAECRIEGEILKRMAPRAIDDCGGLFVAVEGDDEAFAAGFAERCAAAGIDSVPLTVAEARRLEPAISERAFAAYAVPDASVDPFRLTIEQVADAGRLADSLFLPHTEVVGFEIENGRILAARCRDTKTGETRIIRARQFVNAAGAWSMAVARLAGCDDVHVVYSKGTLVIANTRLTRRVVNRLRRSGDGDILVPGGSVSLLGTTSDTIAGLDVIRPTPEEVDRNIQEGAALIPALARTRFIRAFAGVRPLLLPSGGIGDDGRKASRGFTLFDHLDQGLENFATIAGGKLTTFRLMAERTGDLVAARLGNREPCRTAVEPLPALERSSWTEPGHSARVWIAAKNPADNILCECEMVPKSTVDAVLEDTPGAEPQMPLRAIGVRSRIGKGTCQGSFCSIRVTSHLYDRGTYTGREGLATMRDFLAERYKGTRPVLWGAQMPQAELAETLHCGLSGLDLIDGHGEDGEP
ncbi:anaerobic glycerol-3-phosphate dehydrogenase subunit A [Pinisolibacter sp.]|uniref:anaerobic glycerol-3-phosphate dehydrogenase subunit A n=1 Tax=Pinisolibacter sp. TaxID=2172024 RepID=UPI002FDE7628